MCIRDSSEIRLINNCINNYRRKILNISFVLREIESPASVLLTISTAVMGLSQRRHDSSVCPFLYLGKMAGMPGVDK